MMEKMKKLNECFSFTNGIFSRITAMTNIPWAEDVEGSVLDFEYLGNRSGMKPISPLVYACLNEDGNLSDNQRDQIAEIAYALNIMRWKKLYATLQFEYDPIENYDMVEQMQNDNTTITYGKAESITHGKTDTLTHATTDTITHDTTDQTTHNTTDTITHDTEDQTTHNTTDTVTRNMQDQTTHNTTETRTPNLSDVSEHTVQGFDSSTYQPAEKTTDTHSGTEANAKTGTETLAQTGTEATARTGSETTSKSGTETDAKTGTETLKKTGTETDARTGSETTSTTGTDRTAASGSDLHEHSYTLTRHGNIGVTTSQQMIESERSLWLWNFFYDVVFPDVDKVLTLRIY